jgi:hypothetical protein
MMGERDPQKQLWSYQVNLNKRVRSDHPLRRINQVLDLGFVRPEVTKFYGIGATLILLNLSPFAALVGEDLGLDRNSSRPCWRLFRRVSQSDHDKLTGFDPASRRPTHEPSSTCSDALGHDPAKDCNKRPFGPSACALCSRRCDWPDFLNSIRKRRFFGANRPPRCFNKGASSRICR